MAECESCKNEERLAKLEGDTRVNDTKISNLVNSLDNLTTEIRDMSVDFKSFVKWLIITTITALATVSWFFLSQHYGG